MIQLNLCKKFLKSFAKISYKKQIKVRQVLDLFKDEPFHKSFRRHKLKGLMKDYESLDVTGDIRVIIHPVSAEVVDVIDIGSHSQLY